MSFRPSPRIPRVKGGCGRAGGGAGGSWLPPHRRIPGRAGAGGATGPRPGWAALPCPGFLTGTYLPDVCRWKNGDIKIKLRTCIETEPFVGSRTD